MGRNSKRPDIKVLHVTVEHDDGWLIAQALEEPGIITQARSLDELVTNLGDAAHLLTGQKDIQFELILPPGLPTAKTRGRKHPRRSVA